MIVINKMYLNFQKYFVKIPKTKAFKVTKQTLNKNEDLYFYSEKESRSKQ